MAERAAAVITPAPATGLGSACWADDVPVCGLADWQARGLPRFGDRRWDFRDHPHAIDKAHEAGWIYDWGVISDPAHGLAMREFAMGRMNLPLQLPGIARLTWPPSTTISYLRALEPFLSWVDTTLHGAPLGTISQQDLNRYAQSVLTSRRGWADRTARLRSPQMFFAYFAVAAASEDPDLHLSLATELIPWAGKSVTTLTGRNRRDQNRTPRIAPAVMDPLLRWALFYVEVAAADILAAHRELQSYPCDAAYGYGTDDYSDRLEQFLRDRPAPVYANGKLAAAQLASAARLPKASLRSPDAQVVLDASRLHHGTETVGRLAPSQDLLESVRQFVAARRRAGRGIPVYDLPEGNKAVGDVNVSLSIAMCGHYPAADSLSYRDAASILRTAHSNLGGEAGGMNAPLSTDPSTGRAWRARFSPASLARETRMLQTACFIVITYLSGMRVDEVLALRPGCARLDTTADGVIYVHRLVSTLSKRQPTPVAATWVVTDHVHEAVKVLEQLPRSLARNSNGRVTVRARRRADRLVQFGTNLNAEIHHFVTGINRAQGSDVLDSHGVNARALRRTLAWYVAHRPFGTTALAIQYKHVHATITEGYVGTGDDEFRDLLASEQVAAELEALAQRIIARRDGVTVVRAAQPSGTSKRIEQVAGDTTRFPGLVDPDGHYEQRLLRDQQITYHVGGCANCAFDPAFSLCNPGADRPIMAHCRWWDCACAEHLPEHLAAVEHAIGEARRHLRLQRLPAPQRQMLRGQIDAMQAKRDAMVESTHGS